MDPQFVGAEGQLRETIQGWDKNQPQEFLAEQEMQWQFTTPEASHQNGCTEALVKSCKVALKKAIGEQVLTPFELQTCLLEIASLVNQHPIGCIPNDPDDGLYYLSKSIAAGASVILCSTRTVQPQQEST